MADAPRRRRLPGFKEMAERQRELGAEFALRRQGLGLSQTEVAARMGTSQSAVARLEAGALDVRLSTLARYAQALGDDVDVHLLFGEPRR
ncbi:MAG: helix-turn-helix domain-containing protein [Acidimicrobiales bacterium]